MPFTPSPAQRRRLADVMMRLKRVAMDPTSDGTSIGSGAIPGSPGTQPGGGSGVTVQEADGAPSVGDVQRIQFGDGFTLTDQGTRRALVEYTPPSDTLNLVRNSSFEDWPAGPGPFTAQDDVFAAPWYIGVISGGSTISVERNATDEEEGTYCARVVHVQVNPTMLHQLYDGDHTALRGRHAIFAARVKGVGANSAYASISDGTQVDSSAYSGSGGYETLSVGKVVKNNSTMLRFSIIINATGTFYIDKCWAYLAPDFRVSEIDGAPDISPVAYLRVPNGSVSESSATDRRVTLGNLVVTSDTRIPSQDENDALQGTAGTPSNTNRYVTNEDTRLGALNLLENGRFDTWPAGAGPFTADQAVFAEPWFINNTGGSTISVSRDDSNEYEATYCAAVTYTHVGTTSLRQLFGGDHQALRGRRVMFKCKVKTATAAAVLLSISDGTPVNDHDVQGSAHSGDGTWQTLYVSKIIDPDATEVLFRIVLFASATVYVDQAHAYVMAGPLVRETDFSPLVDDAAELEFPNGAIGTVNQETGYVPLTGLVVTTDSRLSDARTPTAHAASHVPFGTDALPFAVASLLINGGFEIWQRGAGAFTADLAYTADRWQIDLAGTSTLSVSRDGSNQDANSQFCAALTYVHNTASVLRQQIEGHLRLRSVTLTLTLRVRTSTANAARAYIADSAGTTQGSFHTGGGSYETLTVTRTINSGATSLFVGVELAASATVYVDNATLVVGSQAARYLPVSEVDDLERCHRYYQVVRGSSRFKAAAGGDLMATGVNYYARPGGTPTITLTAGTRNNLAATYPQTNGIADTGFRLEIASNAAGDTFAVNEAAACEWNP